MSCLPTIYHLEWLLFGRRWRLLFIAAALAVLGGIVGRDARSLPLSAWGSVTNTSAFVSFLLVALAGDSITRSRAERVDGVLLSTPVTAAALVVSAYLAETFGLALLSSVYPLIAMLADHGDKLPQPPLGPHPYLAGWIWLVLMPLVFGAALAQLGMLVFGGRRALLIACLLLLWAVPALAPGRLELLDISTIRLATDHHLAHLAPLTHLRTMPFLPRGGVDPTAPPRLPPRLPGIFYANRAMLLAMAVICLAITTGLTRSYRQGL